MKLENYSNSKKQGDAGLGAAIGTFTLKGYTVSIPLTDSQPYDLIIDYGEGVKTIQVKTTTAKRRNNFIVTLRTCGGNRSGTGKIKDFDPSKVDFVYVLTSDMEEYLIPSEHIKVKTSITLSKGYLHFRI